jgi:putative solute:sodium symporter small subunit
VTAGSSSARRTARDELAEDTAHGELYLAQLRRAQLELSLLGLVAFGGVVGSLPLLFALVPWLAHAALLGVPLAAWLVAVPAFPVFVVIGVVYERRANALDQSFRDLIREE